MARELKSVPPPVADIHAHRILILDFGAQYTQLIARRVREIGVYCEIFPWDVTEAEIRAFKPRGIILSGGPESVTDTKPPLAPDIVYKTGVPVLGICYGMQAMAQQLGGKVTAAKHREFGFARVMNAGKASLLRGLSDHTDAEGRPVLDVWMSHGDHVDVLPPGFMAEASTGAIPLAAMADEKRKFYDVQVHP
jgi:GMP synthase (glutamine-hydrolysing)